MLRPVSLLPALLAVVATLTGLGVASPSASPAAAAGAMHRAVDAAPLSLTIDDLSPSTIPRSGPIRISGRVTNVDQGTWQAINLYAFVSRSPMTTSAEIVEAAQTPESTEVGARIIDDGAAGTKDTIDVLPPGTSSSFSLTIPRRDLKVSAPGVYWFGVHALGEGPEGRLQGADGRARTFLPLVPARTRATVDAALVVPIRRDVRHHSDGRIDDLAAWTTALSPGGRLYAAAEIGASAGDHPVTWVVDPAVIDAARRLAVGNPPRSLAPTIGPGEPDADAQPSPPASDTDHSASPEPSPSPSAEDGGKGKADEKADPETLAAATAASAWLEQLRGALEGDEILVLPYGDTDLAAAATHDPTAYRTARDRSGTVLQPWGLPATPVVTSPTGYLPADAMRLAQSGTTVLTSDATMGADAPTVADTAGRRVVVSASATATGGPGPDDRLGAVALRQRILSDAAVHLLSQQAEPLVVQLPRSFTSSTSSDFFEGLDVDWLHLTRVSTIATAPATDVPEDRLVYPASERERELGAFDFASADDLTRAGGILQNLLTLNDEVGGLVRDEALTDVGYSNRADPTRTRLGSARARNWIQDRLDDVTVEAPKAVILAGGSGRFSASITNRLDQPVSVRLTADADPPLRVAVPDRTYDVAAGARTSILLTAANPGLGVRTVRLELTDTDGAPLGSSDSVPMRSNRVSNVIWVIVGIGIALLFGAIGVRLVRRIRTARRS